MDMSWDNLCDAVPVRVAGRPGRRQRGGRCAHRQRCPPGGKLTDTIVRDLSKVPAAQHFGGDQYAEYVEDVYVGYRYLESFDPDNVQYPFGYGMSYTHFGVSVSRTELKDGKLSFWATVSNTGTVPGKEVVQV